MIDKLSQNKIIENYIKSIDANIFQDFCDRLLLTLYPSDYTPVRAGGRFGDMKNDGYCYLNRIFFQAHASRGDTIANIEKKIQTDFEGCLRQQRDVKKFIYITNDIQVGKVENFIDKLRKVHGTCEIESWSPKKIATIIDSFPIEKIEYIIDCNLNDYEKLNCKARGGNGIHKFNLLITKDLPLRFIFIFCLILFFLNWKTIDIFIKLIDVKNIFFINARSFPDLNIAVFAILSIIAFITALIITIKNARKRIKCNLQKGITFDERKKIVFPRSDFIENPIFEERIRELFELKYFKNNLALERLTNDKILYGKYKEGFRDYYLIIYCDDNHNNRKVTQQQISNLNILIEKSILPNILKNRTKNTLFDIFYISELCKTFEKPIDSPIVCQNEEDLLNSLVDFTPYLNRLIDKFKHEKVFSAITKDEDKKTIFETFIEPSYTVVNNNVKNDLKQYIDNWLIDSSNSKQLVLLGDYGMGKTTFLKHYSATLAQEIIEGKVIKRFPVYISLTNTSPMHGGITKSLGAFVAENLGTSFALFEKLIQKGKLLFILDAFDEMGFIGTHEQRFKQFQEIWTLATKNNKIILSGRPSYFSTDIELREFLNIPEKGQEFIQTYPYCEKVILNNLDTNRIKNYIRKY